MKVYSIKIYYKAGCNKPDHIERFPNGIDSKNLKGYFLNDESISYISGYNTKSYMVYEEFCDGNTGICIRNKYKEVVYRKYYNDRIFFPAGKEKYDDYMKEKQTEYKRKKLEKILNKD